MRPGDLLALLVLLLLLAASGEREDELRGRLRNEQAFSESVAYEAGLWAESLAPDLPRDRLRSNTHIEFQQRPLKTCCSEQGEK